jgi:hypothetical protein
MRPETTSQISDDRCIERFETAHEASPLPRACRIVLQASLAVILVLQCVQFSWAANIMTDRRSNIELVRYYYAEVKKTEPSMVDAEQHMQLIQARLKCYFDNPMFTERVNNCNPTYINKIVQLARDSLTARPSLGDFTRKINICPVLYNMCMGKEGEQGECVLYERKCIDYFLDKFWRGNWEYTLKEME